METRHGPWNDCPHATVTICEGFSCRVFVPHSFQAKFYFVLDSQRSQEILTGKPKDVDIRATQVVTPALGNDYG
jgi:hypothetical protein